jgi:hypothetical protein
VAIDQWFEIGKFRQKSTPERNSRRSFAMSRRGAGQSSPREMLCASRFA